MSFNIFFTVKGPGGVIEVPNKENPVEAKGFEEVLNTIIDSKFLSNFIMGLEIIGVKVEKAETI